MAVYSSNAYLTKTQMTSNAQYILNYLSQRGWTKNAICGMLGNMQRESTINPGIWQSLNYGNYSGGYGLVQWTPASKYTNWAEAKGYDIGDINGQLEKILEEVETNTQWIATSAYNYSFKEFTTSTDTPENLAHAFLLNYERAGVLALTQRQQNARYWYTNLNYGTSEDGYQYFMFPMKYMYISQDEYGEYSHQGILAIDFLGWDENGRVYKCPYYAPCDCTCIAKSSSGDWVVWESDDKVHCADGTLSKMCWVQIHDDTPFPVGTKKKQGEIIGHTGTKGNVTGDHLHLNVARGSYSGWGENSQGSGYLINSCHIYEVMYVPQDIHYISGNNHNWFTVPEIQPPSAYEKRKKNFNFILFDKRKRGIYG